MPWHYVQRYMYEMLGFAGSSLSAVTKIDAGQKPSRKHQTPNILYMMLGKVLYLLHDFFLNSSKVGLGSITPFFNKINKVSVSEVSFLSILA